MASSSSFQGWGGPDSHASQLPPPPTPPAVLDAAGIEPENFTRRTDVFLEKPDQYFAQTVREDYMNRDPMEKERELRELEAAQPPFHSELWWRLQFFRDDPYAETFDAYGNKKAPEKEKKKKEKIQREKVPMTDNFTGLMSPSTFGGPTTGGYTQNKKKKEVKKTAGKRYAQPTIDLGEAAAFDVDDDKVDSMAIMRNLNRAAIKKLARRGGVKRISAKIYDEARVALFHFLHDVLTDTVVYVDHAGRSTVRPLDIVNSLKRRGRMIYGYGGGS